MVRRELRRARRGSVPHDSDRRDARAKIGVVQREQVYLFSATTGVCGIVRVRASIALFAIANASVDDEATTTMATKTEGKGIAAEWRGQRRW